MKLLQALTPIFLFTILGCKSVQKKTIDYLQLAPVNPDQSVNMIVEIPTGTTAKYEINKSTYILEMDSIDGKPRYIDYLGYPGNYGMIPNTILPKSLGGDGDPLDILLLGPSESRGNVLKVRVIGVLELLDNGEQDDKLIAVKPNSAWDKINNLEDLDIYYPGTKYILATFFENYKGKGKIVVKNWSGKSKAMNILENSIPKKVSH